MKRILTITFLLICAVSYSQQYTNNPAWGVGVKRFVITEGDTVGTKLGVTIISGVLYVANGTKWTPVGTGGSSLPPQTGNNGKYLKTNGTSASWQLANLLDSIDYTNAGTATVLRVKPGGSGLYKYEFALGGGINTLSVSDPLKTTGTSTPTLSIDTVTRPEGLFTLGKWAKDSAAIIASIASKSGRVYAGNGLTNVNDSTLRTDTSLTATKDYVNYKDDIQQGFIDLRKLESDSTASSGYTRRDRALNIAQETTRDSLNVVRSSLALKLNISDTAAMLSKYRDSLNSHNSRIITNTQNIATNTSDILLRVKYTDTSNAGGAYTSKASRDKLKDSLQANIALKLNASDSSLYALRTPNANVQTASYTLVLSDAGKLVEINNASANTLTIPPNSSVAFPIGTVITGVQRGAGITTITAGSGVTITSFNSWLRSGGQYAYYGLRKTGTDTWDAFGNIMP